MTDAARCLAVVLLAVPAGCRSPVAGPSPTSVGLPPAELTDPNGYGDGPPLPLYRDLYRAGEKLRADRLPKELPAKKTVLALSGGGSFGAYQAGVLVGWSEAGTRPRFDCVTGVSTGALAAALAFLGPDYDGELRRVYTALKTADVYTKRGTVRGLLSDSLADNTPLARQIDRVLTLQTLDRIAAEHRAGRRLYVGTTDLEGRRPVVWDVGAMAQPGTPAARDLVAKVLLASAAIPAFFSPVEIPVEVDGRALTEKHVDGGVTQGVFFMPPLVPREYRARPPIDFLAGSDLYVIVAGKLFADPDVVKPRALKIAAGSVSTLIYAETRGDLVGLYAATLLAGMNYRVAAVPQDFASAGSATDFDPAVMTRLFDEGRKQALAGTAWRDRPPGAAPGELFSQRAGVTLTRTRPGPTGDEPPRDGPRATAGGAAGGYTGDTRPPGPAENQP